MKDKYFDFVDNSVSTSNKIAFFYSINNNFIALILKTTTFLFTIYLISLVKTTTLTLSLYLTLTPYLSSSAENLISFFELFSEIGNTDNTLKEFDALKFQSEEENKEEDVKFQNFNLCFSKVGFKNGNNKKLNQIDLYLPFKSSTLFVGEANCGKREIFLMLKREKKATYGSILVDNKNIYDMNEHQFLNIFYFVTKKPFFYNLSIYENLYLVCQNRNKIFKAIKILELKQEIDKLESGINTVISEKFNEKLLFYLGLARAYLSDAKIICIYETPPNLNKNDKQFLCKLLKTININCTVIMFCHENTLGFDFNNVIYIESLNTKNAN